MTLYSNQLQICPFILNIVRDGVKEQSIKPT